jgi:hypothetical protein
VKPKNKNFGLFWCFEPKSNQPKQIELFRKNTKQTETSSVCSVHRNIKTLCFGIEAKQPKRTVSKQTKKTKRTKKSKIKQKNPKK